MSYKPPYFLLYVNDLLSSAYVDLMDAEQFGWYMKLLMRSWQSDEPCYLPNDPDVLRSILRIGRKKKEISNFSAKFSIVFERFSVTEDGAKIYHSKLLEQYIQLVQKYEKQVLGGKSTQANLASKQAGNLPANHAGNLTGKHGANHRLSQISDTKINTKPKPLARDARDDRFTPVKEFIEQCCARYKVPFIWDGSEGKQLNSFLQSAGKGMSIRDVCILVKNRFNSREAPGDRPRLWLSNLGRYATEQRNGKQTSAERNQQSTVDAVRAVVASYEGMDSSRAGSTGDAVGQTIDASEIESVRGRPASVSAISTTHGISAVKN